MEPGNNIVSCYFNRYEVQTSNSVRRGERKDLVFAQYRCPSKRLICVENRTCSYLSLNCVLNFYVVA